MDAKRTFNGATAGEPWKTAETAPGILRNVHLQWGHGW